MIKILIIKLGAKGDVIRTLPILEAIKEKYLSSEITWITKENIKKLLDRDPLIDQVLTFLPNKNFDILYNFDIDKEATEMAKRAIAEKKYGFKSEENFVTAFNFGAEYYLNTLFDDELKKTNKKTYQEMMFEAAELHYKKQHREIFLNQEDFQYAQNFLEKNNLKGKKLLGVHIGASPRWPSKRWHIDRIKEFISRVSEQREEVLLFAGPNELQEQEEIKKHFQEKGIKINTNDPFNSDSQFASLIKACEVVVCADSFALHIAIALKKSTIALFFCTTPHEVEPYTYLKKVVSPIFEEFFPEKQDQYSEELINSISVEEVLDSLSVKGYQVINAIIFDREKEKFLIIKRKEGIHSGKWAFPGGIVEGGENLKQALLREIKEETSLEVEIMHKISEYTYLRGEGKETKGECYLAFSKSKEVKINPESEDYAWVNKEEFPNFDHIKGLDFEVANAYEALKNTNN